MRRIGWTLGLLLLLCPPAIAKDTIIVVLDASGSMMAPVEGGGTRMDGAKEALKRVLPAISGQADLGIVVFSATNLGSDWVYPVGRIHPSEVVAAVDQPLPGGGTPLGKYIKVGADELLFRRKAAGNAGRFILVLVTDGENTEGPDPEPYLLEAKRKGILVHLIGLGMSGEHSLSQAVLAMPTPGTYQSAQDATSLAEAVTRATSEAPVRDGAIDPAIFGEIAPLPDQVAASMVQAITSYNNNPIGTPDPVITVDATGKVVMSEAAQGGSWWAVIIGVVVVALLLLVGWIIVEG